MGASWHRTFRKFLYVKAVMSMQSSASRGPTNHQRKSVIHWTSEATETYPFVKCFRKAYKWGDNLGAPIAPRAIGPYWPKKGPIGGPLGPQNSKEKWTLMTLDRNGMKWNFNLCFLDVSGLADILGIAVWFCGFLIFDHFWPSSSPGSQHLFFLGHISQSCQKVA